MPRLPSSSTLRQLCCNSDQAGPWSSSGPPNSGICPQNLPQEASRLECRVYGPGNGKLSQRQNSFFTRTDRYNGYCGCCIDLCVHLTVHGSPIGEQDPKILKVVHLRQDVLSNLERAIHFFWLRIKTSDFEVLIFIPAPSLLVTICPSACCMP